MPNEFSVLKDKNIANVTVVDDEEIILETQDGESYTIHYDGCSIRLCKTNEL